MKDELPIKYYQDLLTSKGRKEHSAFIVEGIRQVEQFVNSNKMKILEILCVPPVGADPCVCPKSAAFDGQTHGSAPTRTTKIPVRYINSNILGKITDSKTPNGVIAVVEIPKSKTTNETQPHNINRPTGKVLMLENIQDPGNVGTLIRSAAAFGFSTVILSQGCADVYSPKVVRSTGGALCNLDIISAADIFDCIEKLKKQKYKLVVADSDGESGFLPKRKDENVIFALGNEGNGVSDKLKSLADFVFTIPFDNSAIESLNVSTAGAVGMYLLRKKDLE